MLKTASGSAPITNPAAASPKFLSVESRPQLAREHDHRGHGESAEEPEKQRLIPQRHAEPEESPEQRGPLAGERELQQ